MVAVSMKKANILLTPCSQSNTREEDALPNLFVFFLFSYFSFSQNEMISLAITKKPVFLTKECFTAVVVLL